MIRYRKLGYVALNVSDVARSMAFYVDQVGLADAGAGPGGARFLRCGTSHHDLMLCSGTPGLKRIGFEMESDESLDELCSVLVAQGLAVRDVDEAECAALHVTRAVRIAEPLTGVTYEFFARMREVADPFVPTVAKIQRLGHVVLKTGNYAAAVRFFTRTLNFQVSDLIDGMVTFLRCYPNPFHHSFALANSRKPGLHHVNLMVSEVDDIGRAIWRFQKAGVPVVHGPGRHPPSGSMFYYFLDPDGLTVEYSFGMEEFPPAGARPPRLLEPVQASFDYWGAIPDARKSSTGAIEAWLPV
ncbi:MAG: bleomycin resistance protein [Betaproteobacteria bacterium]|nr:bleomycin resistance protein [Betaproteobacteria bacterium]